MLCILKDILVLVAAVWVLFFPLGDPHVLCKTVASTHNKRMSRCHWCDAYFVAEKTMKKILEVLHFSVCLLMEVLYEAKLKFYVLLETVDGEDLCRSVCGSRDGPPKVEISKEIKRSKCKCIKSRRGMMSDC